MRLDLILGAVIAVAGLCGAALRWMNEAKNRRLVQIEFEINKFLKDLKSALAESDSVRISFIESELRRLRQERADLTGIRDEAGNPQG